MGDDIPGLEIFRIGCLLEEQGLREGFPMVPGMQMGEAILYEQNILAGGRDDHGGQFP
jgi:hypothetical protein